MYPLILAAALWLDPQEALQVAEREGKVVLVEVHETVEDGRPRPSGQAGRLSSTSFDHPAIQRAYRSFVLARAASFGDAPVPSFALVDSDGTIISTFAQFDDPSPHLQFLNVARDQLGAIIRARSTRKRGAAAEADMLLGDVAMRLLNVARAGTFFSRASEAFRSAGDEERADKAVIAREVARAFQGDRAGSLTLLRQIAAHGSPSVSARAHLAIARIHQTRREQTAALAALRRAFETAPGGSEEKRQASSQLAMAGEATAIGSAGVHRSISIITSQRATLSGRAAFSAVTRQDVRRVVWYLDSIRVAVSDRAPFTTRLDLGATPRLHVVEAVAFDAGGRPISRAVARLNDRIEDARVTIMSPVSPAIEGPVDLEADVYVPPSRKLETVQFFWNGNEIAAFSGPPYASRFTAPPTFGYFQVKASFDDGATAEDAVIVNSTGFGEAVDVHTVAFSATVTDRKGKPLSGLRADDFRVFDESLPVSLTMRDASDEPVTIGLAIDMSSSMSSLLLPLLDMSAHFVDLVTPRDKVFLIAFNEQPHLIHPPSANAASLRSKLFDQYASGGTALADALSFSIQQFRSLPGKKALVLITDGNEGSSDQSAKACIAMARESGVPIYVILPKESMEIERAAAFRKVLNEVAVTTGGLFFNSPRGNVFPRILEYVRGQYLLSFQAPSQVVPGQWRSIRVDVSTPGARVRTISGYYGATRAAGRAGGQEPATR